VNPQPPSKDPIADASAAEDVTESEELSTSSIHQDVDDIILYKVDTA
jgi:hypothetical protein